MTDRGLPIVDGAPACPFVAFEDDRDGRALAPDHRHRCFAEPRPAPRALAHQEAYCLASAFPVCPTFQDWARREAAAARTASADGPVPRDEPPVSRPMPPPGREPRQAQGDAEIPQTMPPRRNPPRNWAAPPPWSGDEQDPMDVEAPLFLTGRDPARDDPEWGAASRGLVGSAAARLAGPDPASGAAYEDDQRDLEDWAVPPAAPTRGGGMPPGRAAARPANRDVGRVPPRAADRPAPQPSRRDQVRRRPEEEAVELFGPAWERPHRYEAYPSLRTRMGLPNLPKVSGIGVAVVALVLAGVALFFVGPMLLGVGGKPTGPGGAGPTTAASVEPTATPLPTAAPAPTPTTYTIVNNDVMSKIATRFGVTLAQLLAANPQIKNPDRIKEGDVINIPVPQPSAVPGVVGGSTAP